MEKLSERSVSAAHPRCRMTLIARKRPSRSYRMRFRINKKGASIMMHSHQTVQGSKLAAQPNPAFDPFNPQHYQLPASDRTRSNARPICKSLTKDDLE